MICPVCNTQNTSNSENCQQCNSNLKTYRLLYELNQENLYNSTSLLNKGAKPILLYIILIINILTIILLSSMFIYYINKNNNIHTNIVSCPKTDNQLIDQETLHKFQDIILLELSLYNKNNPNNDPLKK